jgi:hypothetical protein
MTCIPVLVKVVSPLKVYQHIQFKFPTFLWFNFSNNLSNLNVRPLIVRADEATELKSKASMTSLAYEYSRKSTIQFKNFRTETHRGRKNGDLIRLLPFLESMLIYYMDHILFYSCSVDLLILCILWKHKI